MPLQIEKMKEIVRKRNAMLAEITQAKDELALAQEGFERFNPPLKQGEKPKAIQAEQYDEWKQTYDILFSHLGLLKVIPAQREQELQKMLNSDLLPFLPEKDILLEVDGVTYRLYRWEAFSDTTYAGIIEEKLCF